MTSRSRFIPALGAVFLAATAVTLSACGSSSDSVPSSAVANVGGMVISKPTFNHWMQIAADSSSQSTTGASTPQPVPVPPNFTACVAQLKATTPKPAKGQPAPTDSQFKAQCAEEYATLQSQVMQFLVSADWVLGESASQGVSVTDQAVSKQFATVKKQEFPTAAAFSTFLKQSGQTLDDLLLRVKLELLSNKLRTKVEKGKATVTDADVANYYNSHKSSFGTPESVNLRIILTKTKAQAQAAKAAVASGTSFSTEAKKVSIDQASKANGGALTGVTKGQEEQALNNAIFSAPLHTLEGPVQTPFGFYVFQVQKQTPSTQQPLSQAKTSIKSQLVSQKQTTVLNNFVKDFQKQWTGKTNCATGFVVQDCKQYKAPKTPTTGTTLPSTGGSGG